MGIPSKASVPDLLLRLIVFPLIAVVAFAGLERSGIHPDAEYILMIVLIATSAPAAA